MNPMKRKTRGVVQTEHENRIQTLERRIPEAYPQVIGVILDTITVQLADNYPFGFSFGESDPCLPEDECDPDEWRTDGEYLLLPLGYDGAFKVYMAAALTGGNSNFGNYRTVVDGGDQDEHGKSAVDFILEVWRDDAPFGFDGYRAFRSWGEHPPPASNVLGNKQRYWWNHTIVSGTSTMNPERDRYAIWPYFALDENLAGNANIGGLVLTVEMIPPFQTLPGESG